MGDVTHIYDTNGALKAHYIYDAWGNHKITTDVNGIGTLNPIRYRGYYYDTETGLYYLEARYYDPETGRFISQDNIDFIVPEHLTGLNLYVYCNNNPVMYSDPSGCFAFTTAMIIGLIAGAVIGGTLGGVSAYQSAQASGKSGWELAGATLFGEGTGAVLGAGVGLVATAGTPYLIGGLTSLGSKLVADTVAYTTFGKPFGSWEDYAISFVFGGLTKGKISDSCCTSIYSKKASYLKYGDHTTDIIADLTYKITNGNTDREKYSYDKEGNISAIHENGRLKVRYTYDVLNRLIREDNKELDLTTTFEYDNGGNLIRQNEYAYTLVDTDQLTDGKEIVYTYSESRSDVLTDFNGEAIAYQEHRNQR